MHSNDKGQIALISVHGDPSVEIGQDAAGGQNVYVRKVGEGLARQGWMVDMFTRRVSVEQDKVVEHGPHCRTIRLNAGPPEFIERSRLFDHLPEFVESFRQHQHQSELLYPLIHTHYWLSSWVGLELKNSQPMRMVHTYHSLGSIKYDRVEEIPPVAQTRLSVEKACLEQADCVVATSPQERDDMRETLSSHGTVEVIPCGTTVEHFGRLSRTEARDRLNIPQDQKVVLYVGRFDPRKGIETLVRAVGQPQVRQHHPQVLIVGGSRSNHKDSQEHDRIEALVDELDLKEVVTFMGRLDHSELPIYYAAADVCVVPSHYEPFGLVAIEAMASHTPVVASRVGGLKFTTVQDETGFLVPPKDAEAFGDAIDRILSNSTLRDRLGQAGRERVNSHFSWDGVTRQLSDLYQAQLRALYNDFFVTSQ